MRPRHVLLFLIALLLAATAAASPRRRAVRSPGPGCTWSHVATFTNPVPDSGMVRGAVQVVPDPPTCTSWAAYSPVDWIEVELEPMQALLTVAPNTAPETRTATVLIAGLPLEITQLGRPAVTDPTNLLRNATFNTDIAFWGWQERFPNGSGDASWSSLDANGDAHSGSIRLRDDMVSSLSFQQLQCVNAAPGAYRYGAAVRAASRDAARPIIAFFEYPQADCAGEFARFTTKIIQVTQSGAWERYSYLDQLSDGYKSILIVIASWAREPGLQEVWIDDVFVRPR